MEIRTTVVCTDVSAKDLVTLNNGRRRRRRRERFINLTPDDDGELIEIAIRHHPIKLSGILRREGVFFRRYGALRAGGRGLAACSDIIIIIIIITLAIRETA